MNVLQYVKNTWEQFSDDDGFMMASALAYYTLFSIAPLLVIIIATFSFLLDSTEIEAALFQQLGSIMGYSQSSELQDIVDNARDTSSGALATVISTATLVVSSTAVVVQLKTALNRSWNLAKDPDLGMISIIMDRILSLGFLLGIGFIFLVSMGLNTIAIFLADKVSRLLPYIGETSVLVISIIVSQVVTFSMFYLLFKFLPDAKLHRKDLIVGALVTTILFVIGRFAIGFYIGNSNISTTFGGAGALASFMVWVYYNSIILIIGAEFTQVYAMAHNRVIMPTDNSVKVQRILKRKGEL